MLRTYTITITNKNSEIMNYSKNLDLVVISPNGIVTPGIPYENYISDENQNKPEDIMIPLYEKNQIFILNPKTILTIVTQNSNEAAYYIDLQLDNATITVTSDESLVTESLKDLYVALGGESSDVENLESTLDVLNAISAKYNGEDNAEYIPDAIENIAAVAEDIGGGLIPNSIVFTDTVRLGERAPLDKYRSNEDIVAVTLPDGITKIVKQCFKSCSIEEIIIPDGVTDIGQEAFSNCLKLNKVVLPNTLKNIGSNAFSGCSSLQEIFVPDSITTLSTGVFSYCLRLTSVNLPDDLEYIPDGTFNGCQYLTSITLPSHITSIGAMAFNSAIKLKEITIPSSVTSIGNYAFADVSGQIIINKPENSIEGAPWGAKYATIVWTG